ncbi:TPA: hypothetical protein EYH33_03635 [Candidatus Bipolaricaulota bacterium]|nr:hypothetical protein [Candidatus Bipolaricaulota bacterium]
MTVKEALELALRLSGLSRVPADSGVLVPGELEEKVLFAIDVGVAELLLAKGLGAGGVIAHHPPGGQPRLHWHRVLWRHAELLTAYGVPEGEARAAAGELVQEFAARDHTANYDHVPGAARALGLPLVGIHTPLDELGRKRLVAAVGALSPKATLGELLERLSSLPELGNAATEVELRLGSPDRRAGRVAVLHGAGTNGGYPVAACAFRHGIDTVLYIHCSQAAAQRLAEEFPDKNLVVTGHIASDSLGINPFLAELESRGLEVIPLDVVKP